MTELLTQLDAMTLGQFVIRLFVAVILSLAAGTFMHRGQIATPALSWILIAAIAALVNIAVVLAWVLGYSPEVLTVRGWFMFWALLGPGLVVIFEVELPNPWRKRRPEA